MIGIVPPTKRGVHNGGELGLGKMVGLKQWCNYLTFLTICPQGKLGVEIVALNKIDSPLGKECSGRDGIN